MNRTPSTRSVTDVRIASRKLVRELGFMSRNVAGTDLSPSAVHAIVEIGASGSLTAKELQYLLLLEKSTISRLIRSLIERGLIVEQPDETDQRVKALRLSQDGQGLLEQIDAFAENRIAGALALLGKAERLEVIVGLRQFAEVLEHDRIDATESASDTQVD